MNNGDWRNLLLQTYLERLKGSCPAVRILERDAPFGLPELEKLAAAARAEGSGELHLLAWEFPPWPGRQVEQVLEALPLPTRLVRIPREALDPRAAARALFVEAALLDVAVRFHPDGSLDVRLERFRPGLPLHTPVPQAMLARAAAAPFDFLTAWSVDFTFTPGRLPFRHHWSSLRSPRRRTLTLESTAHWKPEMQGTGWVGVKGVDVFGYETVAGAALNPLRPPEENEG